MSKDPEMVHQVMNELTVILMLTGEMLSRIPAEAPDAALLRQIHAAAENIAGLLLPQSNRGSQP